MRVSQLQQNPGKPPEKSVDKRFRSTRFKADVKLVLEYLGEESNIGNFKKYDKEHGSETPINWEQFAFNIRNNTGRGPRKVDE